MVGPFFASLLLLTQTGYGDAMRLAEAAKARGDMAAMERAIQSALRSGSGDEYAWRSLAWSQARQGKWRESLASAKENVRRNGRSSWSLKQLYESAMAAGDAALAGRALAEEAGLPSSARNTELTADRAEYRAATRPCRFDLTWRLEVAAYKVQAGELVVNVPFRKHLWQTADVWVEGAERSRIETISGKDVMFITPGTAKVLELRARVTHRPEIRGGDFAARTRPPFCPSELKGLLGPFRNRVDYDPTQSELVAVTATLGGRTPAEKVQAILDWIADNVRYVDGQPDDLASILRTRMGVCHHQSNLMVAMCRASGIPALVAHGVSIEPGDRTIHPMQASHGWVEVFLNGIGWVGVEPLNRNSLRFFRSGYLIVDASGRNPRDDHFEMKTPDGRSIEGIQGVPVSGTSRILDAHGDGRAPATSR